MSPDDQQLFKGAYENFSHQRFDDCIKTLKKLIKRKVKSEQIFNVLGLAYARKGKSNEALKAFRGALKLNPKSAMSHANLAQVYEQEAKWSLAEASYQQSIACNPSDNKLILNYGLCLQKQEKWADANPVFDAFIRAGGSPLEGYIRKAVCLYGQHLYPHAQTQLNLAKAIDENHAAIRYYQAMIYDKTNKKSLAEQLFLPLIKEKHGPSYFSLGLLYFSIGRWKEAFELNEHRPISQSLNREFTQSYVVAWEGEPLAGKAILLLEEQGIGDQIRYLFFLHPLLKEADKVFVFLDERLYPLITSTFNNVTCLKKVKVTQKLTNDLGIDVTACIGSLGRLYHQALKKRHVSPAIPINTMINCDANERQGFSYLKADAQHVAMWRDLLTPIRIKLVVGACWRSVKTIEERNDWYLTIEQVATLFKGLDVTLVNLQYGASDDEIAYLQEQGVDITCVNRLDYGKNVNFKDDQQALAALLTTMDVVVSAATALSELSAALGVPTIVFATRDTKWFLAEQHMAGFHPLMKLYYKNAFSDWADVISDIREIILLASGQSTAIDA
jgi:tetratricopeptide (TPR) repeat protein